MKKILLKQKIALLIIVVGLSSAVVVGGFVNWYLSDILIENKKIEMSQVTIEQAHELSAVFEKNGLFVKMLATRTRVKEFLLDKSEDRRKELDGIFLDYTKENEVYLSIYLMDEKGMTLISTDVSFVGQNYGFREYFQSALSGIPWVEASIGKTSGQLGYYFSHPVLGNGGEILGVMVVKVDPADIENSILESEISKRSIVMLTDKYGVVLASNDKEKAYKSIGALSQSEKESISEHNTFLGLSISSLKHESVQNKIRVYEGPAMQELYDESNSESQIFGVVKIRDFPFFLVTQTKTQDIMGQVSFIVFSVVAVICLGLLLKSVIIYRSLSFFLRPLKRFESMMKKVSAGDFSETMSLKTGDEFESLSTSVNAMVEDLRNLYKGLDKKIAEKTKEVMSQKSAILNILEDVQEEKRKSELLAKDLEKFKLAVDNASDHIVITDANGIVLYGNKMVEEITGYTLHEALGKKAGSLWKKPMDQKYYGNLWTIIKKDKKPFVGEITNIRKNGEEYQASISISPVLDDKNEVIYFVGIERDITKEKQINKAKTEFVSLASHQLRTPLTSIGWYTEMLLDGDAGKINKEQKKYLSEVYKGNKRMIDLVNALLNVSRIDLGTFSIDPEPIDVVSVAKEMVEEQKLQIKEKKISLKEEYDEIPILQADRKLIGIIFQNLVSNAVKYMSSGGTVSIKITFEKEKNAILISVSDTGYGIPKSQHDKIFQKLFRADNVRIMETEGTGLGLYIVKSIVDQSGGKIWFESEEGKGTVFYVSLPLEGMKKKEGTRKLT